MSLFSNDIPALTMFACRYCKVNLFYSYLRCMGSCRAQMTENCKTLGKGHLQYVCTICFTLVPQTPGVLQFKQ